MKESGKMLEPQVNYTNRSRVNHDWLKLVFSSKGTVSVMCGKFQVISMQYGELPNQQTYHSGRPLKGIKVKSGRFQESTNMNIEYSKLSFFINDD